MTTTFAAVAQHRVDPDRLLLLGDDGRVFGVSLPGGAVGPTAPADEAEEVGPRRGGRREAVGPAGAGFPNEVPGHRRSVTDPAADDAAQRRPKHRPALGAAAATAVLLTPVALAGAALLGVSLAGAGWVGWGWGAWTLTGACVLRRVLDGLLSETAPPSQAP